MQRSPSGAMFDTAHPLWLLRTITVAVRIGFDANRSLGSMETGGKATLPVFREVMLNTYRARLVGPGPSFPADIENNIAAYLSGAFAGKEAMRLFNSPNAGECEKDRMGPCRTAGTTLSINGCGVVSQSAVYQRRDASGRVVFTNE
jgi:hypothetical protein